MQRHFSDLQKALSDDDQVASFPSDGLNELSASALTSKLLRINNDTDAARYSAWLHFSGTQPRRLLECCG
jgi:hypothetical protein